MKYLVILVCLLAAERSLAQVPAMEALEGQKFTLEERYGIMKSKSQTYGEYKVIRENILDGVWRIHRDSVKANKAQNRDANKKIFALETDLQNTKLTLLQKEASMTEIVHDSTHISFFGLDVEKRMFITFTGLTILGLLLLLTVFSGKLKLMNASLNEKIDLVNTTAREFEDYKHKALERQTKLSRELQNERNKLLELKKS